MNYRLLLTLLYIALWLLVPLPIAAQTVPPAPLSPLLPAPAKTAVDQTVAMLPDFRSDLAAAATWNQYTIRAVVEPDAQKIEAIQTLNYTNHDHLPLRQIYFRLFPNLPDFAGKLEILSVAVAGQTKPVIYLKKRYLLQVNLSEPLQPGYSVAIELGFRTTTPANAGRSYYGAFNQQSSVLALASCYPIVAMVQDGIWDLTIPDTRGDLVTSETALYDLTINAPSAWNLATTGSVADRQVQDGRQIVRFASGPQRDFMIVATRLPMVSAEAAGVRINSYYRAGDEAGGKLALQVAINAIQLYNQRFGHYPFNEFEIVPVDAGTFLGVEYPGMVLIEQRLYRNNPAKLETILSHEVAHQWWYSLVGNDVQAEPWLDEAFATYSQVIYAEAIEGQAAGEAELEQFRHTYRALHKAGRDATIGQPGRKIKDYYGVVYAKGALFFAALHNQIGDQAFGRFLKGYYADQRYQIATGSKLRTSAEQACDCSIKPLYHDWIETNAPVNLP